MAANTPKFQKFVEFAPGYKIGIHQVKLLSASDTVTVPVLAHTTSNASSAQVRRNGDPSLTVTDDGSNTVTIVGTTGQEGVVVTMHRTGNSLAEA